MTALPALAIALLVLSVGLYLLAPLFAREAEGAATAAAAEEARLELATRQASVYATLKELDFDLATAKLSPEDHRELSERYTAEAVEILEKMDALAAPRPPAPGRQAR